MRKSLLAFAAIAAFALLLTGCRLSHQPESLAPPAPVKISMKAAPAQPETAPADEAAPAAPEEPTAADYLTSLKEALAQAQAETRKEAFPGMMQPGGSIALGQLSLSLLESRLPQAIALQGINHAKSLIGEKKYEDATKSLDELIIRLEPQIKQQPASEALSVESLQGIIKALVAKKPDEALKRLDNVVQTVAGAEVLKATTAIRSDLEEAYSAAALKRGMIASAVLEDAAQKAADLLATPATPAAKKTAVAP